MSAPVGVVMRRVRPCRVERVEVRCPRCRTVRLITRDAARRRPSHTCQPCAFVLRDRRPASDASPDFRQWWRDRYSLDEIRALAAGLDAPDIPAQAEPAALREENTAGSDQRSIA